MPSAQDIIKSYCNNFKSFVMFLGITDNTIYICPRKNDL